MTLPLEVFMTEKMGWGLRCGVDVPIGAFVVCYIGQVTTEHMAEQSDSNHYQYDLNHFVQQHKVGASLQLAGRTQMVRAVCLLFQLVTLLTVYLAWPLIRCIIMHHPTSWSIDPRAS